MRIFRTVVLSLLPVIGLASTDAFGVSEFSLKLANPSEGVTEFNTADHPSGIYVLEFFQGHCGPCKQNVPNVKALHSDYKDEERVHILDVGIDQSPGKYKQWVAQYKPDYPVLMDLQRSVWAQTGASTTPTTIILDCHLTELYRSNSVWSSSTAGKIRQVIDEQLDTECVAD
jgi:thiol-disulfide isomerase/thioredoxin